MKLKRITFGMGFGKYWNSATKTEEHTHTIAEPIANYNNLISLLLRLMKEQKAMIEQQQADIIEMKEMIKEISFKVGMSVRIEAYQVDN